MEAITEESSLSTDNIGVIISSSGHPLYDFHTLHLPPGQLLTQGFTKSCGLNGGGGGGAVMSTLVKNS